MALFGGNHVGHARGIPLVRTSCADRPPAGLRGDRVYYPWAHDGAVVNIGDRVLQGALVGYSGNTGNTGNKPHLHFSAASSDPSALGTANCPTLPLNFRNTDANPQGPERGRSYTANAH